jgi:hypothetical protein
MFRTRLASVALAAGLGLVSGCASDFSLRNIFHRGNGTCCTSEGTCCGDMEGPMLPAPDSQVIVPGPTMPPVAGTPRLTPAPATPYPYTPSGLIR